MARHNHPNFTFSFVRAIEGEQLELQLATIEQVVHPTVARVAATYRQCLEVLEAEQREPGSPPWTLLQINQIIETSAGRRFVDWTPKVFPDHAVIGQ